MTAHRRLPDLPADGPVIRWSAHRKAAVVEHILAAALTRGEAMSRWSISVEELDSWLRAHRRAGRAGLHAKAVPPVQERLL